MSYLFEYTFWDIDYKTVSKQKIFDKTYLLRYAMSSQSKDIEKAKELAKEYQDE